MRIFRALILGFASSRGRFRSGSTCFHVEVRECYVPNLSNILPALLTTGSAVGTWLMTSLIWLLKDSPLEEWRLFLVGGRLTLALAGDSSSISSGDKWDWFYLWAGCWVLVSPSSRTRRSISPMGIGMRLISSTRATTHDSLFLWGEWAIFHNMEALLLTSNFWRQNL